MEAPYGDVKSEWIKYLNVKPKTIYLQENMGKLCDIRLGNDLQDVTPKLQATNFKGVPWWPNDEDTGLPLFWSRFFPGLGTGIPQAAGYGQKKNHPQATN